MADNEWNGGRIMERGGESRAIELRKSIPTVLVRIAIVADNQSSG